ncbi:unnamed protein product [Cochlearia groenlandica]
MASTTSSPCAACKFLRRKCTQECVFAPYFPPDQPLKFAYVHKIFGASNVAKLLNELTSNQREDAVNSLFYEAEARLRDPVYGCVGLISILQHRLKQLQHDLDNAKKDLASYNVATPHQVVHSMLLPILQPQQPHFMYLPPPHQPQQRPSSSSSSHDLMAIPMGQLYNQQQQQQQQIHHEAQQLVTVNAVVGREQHNEMFRSNSHHQNHQPLLRFENGLDSVPSGSVTVTGFSQIISSSSGGGSTLTGTSPTLDIGGANINVDPTTTTTTTTNDNYYDHHQHAAQLFIQSSQPFIPLQTQETNSESEDGTKSIIGDINKI